MLDRARHPRADAPHGKRKNRSAARSRRSCSTARTVVISPLISPMEATRWTPGARPGRRGAHAEQLAYPGRNTAENMEAVLAGKVKLPLYLAPETALKRTVIGLLSRVQVDCVAVDDGAPSRSGDTISARQWRQLAAFRANFPGCRLRGPHRHGDAPGPRRAYGSAWASGSSGRIHRQLQQAQPRLRGGPGRSDPYPPGPGLPEGLSRGVGHHLLLFPQGSRKVSDYLVRSGHSARPYHAGLDDEGPGASTRTSSRATTCGSWWRQ
ncbi:MAG: hypothetical protein MZV63_07245 [Marinilabiliales bacterium]|nr:hypothetical protein [Marinilabiliales bacterium]